MGVSRQALASLVYSIEQLIGLVLVEPKLLKFFIFMLLGQALERLKCIIECQ